MEINSPQTTTEVRRLLEVRFANGTFDTLIVLPKDTLIIDAVHIRIGTPDGEVIEHDRGGSGVVGYRLKTVEVQIPIPVPKESR